jgi:hypothetical protein
MAFALAVGDLCSPAPVSAFGASTEPPQLGIVTKIGPTTVVWQDGREVTYTPSTGASVDLGLVRFTPDLASPFINAKVRPNGTIPFSNVDGRAEGVCVLAGDVLSAASPNPLLDKAAIVKFGNGLYVSVPQAGIEIVPGA